MYWQPCCTKPQVKCVKMSHGANPAAWSKKATKQNVAPPAAEYKLNRDQSASPKRGEPFHLGVSQISGPKGVSFLLASFRIQRKHCT